MSRLLRNHWKWVVAAALAVAAFVLGFWGFEKQVTEPGQGRSVLDSAYRSLQLFRLEYGSPFEPTSWQLDAARLLAPAALLVVAASVLVAVFHERLQLLGFGQRKERVVICGLGRKGLLLARAFKRRGCLVVVIEQDQENSRIKACRDERIPVLIGDVTDPAMLRKARVHRAKHVIAVCGQDGVNADVAAHARELVAANTPEQGLLTAFVHMVDLELCRLLRHRFARAGQQAFFRLELFNVFESGARAWLNEHPPFVRTGEAPDGRPHLLVVGAGQMGMSLVVGAARQWLTLDPDLRLHPRITIVDREAERRKESLLLRLPRLGEVCDLVAVTTDVTWPEFAEGKFLRGWDGRFDVTTIYVCLDDEARGVAAALELHELVSEDDVPVVLRTAETAGLAAAVQGYGTVRIFPLLDRTCAPEVLLGETPNEMLARGIHEDYVRHERDAGKTVEDNESLVDWHELPEGLKESNRRQADHISVKLNAIGFTYESPGDGALEAVSFTPEQVEYLARMEHDRWVAERLFEGWTYAKGPKNIERKTSPDLVSWEELAEDGREKDRAAGRDLPALLKSVGLGVYPLGRESSR